MTVDGATDTEVFRAYAEQVLCPWLRPGDIVVMDNLSPHKSEPTLQLIEAAGAEVLFLPAYSPDLNPIEKMWSKVKAILRRLKPRTTEEIHDAVRQALKEITASDARGWFESCGYRYRYS